MLNIELTFFLTKKVTITPWRDKAIFLPIDIGTEFFALLFKLRDSTLEKLLSTGWLLALASPRTKSPLATAPTKT